MDRTPITYSQISQFRNCRKAFYWRHIEQLVPAERPEALSFGSLIHECLAAWHKGDGKGCDWYDVLLMNAKDLNVNPLAYSMMKGYESRYPSESFEVIGVEIPFQARIVNPETGCPSLTFDMAGKIDGIVQEENGENYLLEHKTTSSLTADYLERLWCDFQTTLYSHYVREALGIEIRGVIYNVLVKAQIRQGEGETEQEFEERRAALLAKSKTGKTSASRKLPESNEDFLERLRVKYSEPGMFHREYLYVSRDRYHTLLAEVWEITQAMLEARRRGAYYQNTSQCHNFGRCPYFPLCRADGNEVIKENLYRVEAPNQELLEPLPF